MFYVEVRALIIGSEENSEDPPRKLVRAQQLAGGLNCIYAKAV